MDCNHHFINGNGSVERLNGLSKGTERSWVLELGEETLQGCQLFLALIKQHNQHPNYSLVYPPLSLKA